MCVAPGSLARKHDAAWRMMWQQMSMQKSCPCSVSRGTHTVSMASGSASHRTPSRDVRLVELPSLCKVDDVVGRHLNLILAGAAGLIDAFVDLLRIALPTRPVQLELPLQLLCMAATHLRLCDWLGLVWNDLYHSHPSPSAAVILVELPVLFKVQYVIRRHLNLLKLRFLGLSNLFLDVVTVSRPQTVICKLPNLLHL